MARLTYNTIYCVDESAGGVWTLKEAIHSIITVILMLWNSSLDTSQNVWPVKRVSGSKILGGKSSKNQALVQENILCLCFRESLIYINNCPTRCNEKQSIYYSASSFYMFRGSTTPIIRRTQNCNYSLRYWSYFLCSYLPPTWPR